IPQWIFDRASCCPMHLAQSPIVVRLHRWRLGGALVLGPWAFHCPSCRSHRGCESLGVDGEPPRKDGEPAYPGRNLAGKGKVLLTRVDLDFVGCFPPPLKPISATRPMPPPAWR